MSASNLSDPHRDILQPPGGAPPLSAPASLSALYLSVDRQQEKRKRKRALKNSVASINTNRQTSPAKKKAKENNAALSDEIARQISVSCLNLDCLAIDYTSCDGPEHLWLNNDLITAYFCRKIMVSNFRRNLDHHILLVYM